MRPPIEGDGGVAPGEDGTVTLTAAAEELRFRWIAYLRALLRGPDGFVMHVPAFIRDETLERSRYAEHFPQQVLHVAHAEGSGGPRSALSPACCLHVYERCAGARLTEKGVSGVVYGPCARFEGGRWEGLRLSQFTMLEWVAIGTAASLSALDDAVPPMVSAALRDLGLELHLEEAMDPFFAGERSGPAVLQRMSRAKDEWRNPGGVAVGSVNRHSDAYGRRFDIQAGGAPAHSMCVAFGIERLVSESLSCWGESSEGWPAEFASGVPLP